MKSISLLLVDDHPVFRQGLRDVFETDPALTVVAEAADGEAAIAQALTLQPDIVLMDINLPSANGIEITRRLQRELPTTRIIMITGYDGPEQVYYALKAGAAAFCTKDAPPETLLRTVYSVHAGDYVIGDKHLNAEEVDAWLQQQSERLGKHVTSAAAETPASLSPREVEVLELVCQGATNKEIAQQLDISYQTVKNHVTAILHKLGVSDRTQAVVLAIRNGWVQLEETS